MESETIALKELQEVIRNLQQNRVKFENDLDYFDVKLKLENIEEKLLPTLSRIKKKVEKPDNSDKEFFDSSHESSQFNDINYWKPAKQPIVALTNNNLKKYLKKNTAIEEEEVDAADDICVDRIQSLFDRLKLLESAVFKDMNERLEKKLDLTVELKGDFISKSCLLEKDSKTINTQTNVMNVQANQINVIKNNQVNHSTTVVNNNVMVASISSPKKIETKSPVNNSVTSNTTTIVNNVVTNNLIVTNLSAPVQKTETNIPVNNFVTSSTLNPPIQFSQKINYYPLNTSLAPNSYFNKTDTPTIDVSNRLENIAAKYKVEEQVILNLQNQVKEAQLKNNQMFGEKRTLPSYVGFGPGPSSIPYLTPGFRPPVNYSPTPQSLVHIYKTETLLNQNVDQPPPKENKEIEEISFHQNKKTFNKLEDKDFNKKTELDLKKKKKQENLNPSHLPIQHDETAIQLSQDNLFIVENLYEDKKINKILKKSLSKTIFIYFNLIRACITSILTIMEAKRALSDVTYNSFNANWLMIATIVFASVDFFVAFIKAFPKSFWFCWDIKEFDPYSGKKSVFALIADHELLTDVIPLLLNIVVKIYTTRLHEVMSDPDATNIHDFSRLRNFNDPKNKNFYLLSSFTICLFLTILFHTTKIAKVLIIEKKSNILAILVIFKGILLCYDIGVSGFFLYQVLISLGPNLMYSSTLTSLTLSVVIPAPVVSLFTNAFINLPLHYYFVSLLLKNSKKKNSIFSKLAFSANRAFHPLLESIFGTYSIWMKSIRGVEIFSTNGLDIKSLISEELKFKDVLVGLVITNLVINYVVGVVCCLGYWSFVILKGIFGGDKGIRWFKKKSGSL
ncbi:hypothetical protein HDU92_004879 [Lobulomyces angularis]|nr:hypothetical protein HDU92_004879 [Lobulomyces angularis]